MSDTGPVKLSYEELGRPEVDRTLEEIQKQKRAEAARAKAGAHPARRRVLKRFLFLVLAGLLSLALVLSLVQFGKSLFSGKPGPRESETGDLSKPPLPGKTKRI